MVNVKSPEREFRTFQFLCNNVFTGRIFLDFEYLLY